MRPLTERQVAILRYLADAGTAEPHSHIAHGIGIHEGPYRSGPGSGRGGWGGRMNPAQHIISSVRGLCDRGYVGLGRRRDGLSGSAYIITPEGRQALKELNRPADTTP